MIEKDWVTKHKILVVVITLLIIWGTLLAFLWVEADAIRKHPCSVCAEKMSDDVSCTVGNNFLNTQTKTFYVNGSIG